MGARTVGSSGSARMGGVTSVDGDTWTRTAGSGDLFARALEVTPGGVNSPVRAFRAVGGTPRFMARGSGPYLYDVDGNEYVDLVCSWGPMILGHAHPGVVDAVSAAVAGGTSFGTPSHSRGRAGRGDRRAHAGRPGPARVIGHRGDHVGDPTCPWLHRPRPRGEVRRLLPRPRRLAACVAAGSGLATFGIPGTPGVPAACDRATLVLPYNDLAGGRATPSPSTATRSPA